MGDEKNFTLLKPHSARYSLDSVALSDLSDGIGLELSFESV